MKFNEKLKYLREKKGYTQDEIADKLNIARQSVSKWENGINEPDFETLKKICNILDCTVSELIDDNHEIVTTKEMRIKKKETKLFYWNIALFIFAVLVLFVFIRGMNDQVIIHWDFIGNARYGSKWVNLLSILANLIALIFSLICKFALGKYEKYYGSYRDKLQLTSLIIQLLGIVMIFITMCLVDTYTEEKFMVIIPSALFSCVIPIAVLSHPKFNKKNPFFGLKTFFSLSSEEAWNKVNGFAAWAIGISGVISYVLYMVLFDFYEVLVWLIYIPLAIALIVTLIYHEILRNKMENK